MVVEVGTDRWCDRTTAYMGWSDARWFAFAVSVDVCATLSLAREAVSNVLSAQTTLASTRSRFIDLSNATRTAALSSSPPSLLLDTQELETLANQRFIRIITWNYPMLAVGCSAIPEAR